MEFEGIELRNRCGGENFIVEVYGDKYLTLPYKEEQVPKNIINNFVDVDMPFWN